MKKHKTGVFDAVKTAVLTHRGLTAGTLLCVAASVIMSLIPPLLLARIIDRLTDGMPLAFRVEAKLEEMLLAKADGQ